ncbi:MAG: hypothetical protein RMJ00_00345 [Nitrososphaerota archaeon]|nr:hypothetical protein [Candidatus Bathyarchaeota archaeon]MCX8162618.1 hypothetical protein [Candidatus Bathyarchaeota archaeon]MDW8061140.1 hypothetical protein [Nitrososphaerota archaeon]
MSKSIEAISNGIDISMKNPVLFVPYAIPIIVQLAFNALAYLFPVRYYYFEAPNPFIIILGSLIAAILGFIAGCMLVDMANDAISSRPIDIRRSLSLVMNRIGVLIITAIIAALCSITIILLPIGIFIIVIAIIEELNAIESAKKTFDFVIKNLGEVIIFILIVIIISAILSYGFSIIPIIGPYIGSIISWILNAVFTTSAVYFYLSLRPPPPPPPPDI